MRTNKRERYVCDQPRLSVPVLPSDAPLVICDATASATISADLFAPRSLAVAVTRGAVALTWQPPTDRPSTGDLSFVTAGVTTPLDFSVTGTTISADTSDLALASGVLRVEAFAASVTADRCDFRSCELFTQIASDLAVTLE